MADALKAISDPNRRRILELVTGDELTAGQISANFDVTRPAISQHLSLLKQVGLINERREGTRRLYRIRPQGFTEARMFLERLWDDRLQQLKQQAETGETQLISERVCIRREMVIAAPVNTVWGLLTDAGEATRWMGLTAHFDLTPGGDYRVEVVPGRFAVGEFVEIESPSRLAYTWGWEGEAASVVPPGSTIVVFDLAPTDTGTLLRLTHEDLPGMASAGSHSRGWAHYLERLAKAASGGDTGSDPWVEDPERLMAELMPPTTETKQGE